MDRRSQSLGSNLVTIVDRPRIALLELVEGAKEPRTDEVEDGPDLAQSVFDGRAAEGQSSIGLQALGGSRRGAKWILYLLRFVDNDVTPRNFFRQFFVAPEQGVTCDNDFRVFKLVLPLFALRAVPQSMAQRGSKLVHLAQPIGNHACRRNDEHLERIAFSLDFRVLAL